MHSELDQNLKGRSFWISIGLLFIFDEFDVSKIILNLVGRDYSWFIKTMNIVLNECEEVIEECACVAAFPVGWWLEANDGRVDMGCF